MSLAAPAVPLILLSLSIALTTTTSPHHDEPRLMGGYQCNTTTYPFLVSLYTIWNTTATVGATARRCAGSLISPIWVITAAHCCHKDKLTLVMAGSDFPLTSDRIPPANLPKGYQIRQVARFEINPDYERIIRERGGNYTQYDAPRYDIALLKMNASFDITPTVRPGRLPKGFRMWGQTLALHTTYSCLRSMVAMGWGGSDPTKGTSRTAATGTHLSCLRVQFNGKSTCHPASSGHRIMCITSKEEGRDMCQSDSGSPLVCNDDAILGIYLSSIFSYCSYWGYFLKVEDFLYWMQDDLKVDARVAGVRVAPVPGSSGNWCQLHTVLVVLCCLLAQLQRW